MIPNDGPTFNFNLGDEADMIRDSVRSFSQDRIAPLAEKIDREDWFPVELWPEMGELGFCASLEQANNKKRLQKSIES